MQRSTGDGDDLLALESGYPAGASHVVISAMPQSVVIPFTPVTKQHSEHFRQHVYVMLVVVASVCYT